MQTHIVSHVRQENVELKLDHRCKIIFLHTLIVQQKDTQGHIRQASSHLIYPS